MHFPPVEIGLDGHQLEKNKTRCRATMKEIEVKRLVKNANLMRRREETIKVKGGEVSNVESGLRNCKWRGDGQRNWL